MSNTVAIGLGGNLGTPVEITARFDRARTALAQIGAVRSAGLYRAAPIGPPQPTFFNTAISLQAPDLTPGELIATLLELELLLGREREAETRWGPRAIDLDVLLWDDRVIHHLGPPALDVPHPRLAERRFVILPLLELYGADRMIPEHGTLGTLARRVGTQRVTHVAETW